MKRIRWNLGDVVSTAGAVATLIGLAWLHPGLALVVLGLCLVAIGILRSSLEGRRRVTRPPRSTPPRQSGESVN